MQVPHTNENCPIYLLDNIHLDSVKTYGYDSAHIAHNLSWKRHVDFMMDKANRTLRYFCRNFSFAPLSQTIAVYYICPSTIGIGNENHNCQYGILITPCSQAPLEAPRILPLGLYCLITIISKRSTNEIHPEPCSPLTRRKQSPFVFIS